MEASTCILLKQLDIGLVYTKKSCTSAEAGEATGEDGQGDGVMLAIAAVEVGDPYKVSGEAEGVQAQILVALSSLSWQRHEPDRKVHDYGLAYDDIETIWTVFLVHTKITISILSKCFQSSNKSRA